MREQLKIASQEQQPEIFYTLQGEGRHTGEPATFLRLSECNLQCSWCDTPYTWNFEGTPYKHDDDVKYSRDEQQILLTVGEAVHRITQEKAKRLVISGGEPMLQQRKLIELAQGIKAEDPNFKIDIETNGTVIPDEAFIPLVDLFTVSPKLANSGNALSKRERPKALQAYVDIPHADFKFVVTREMDIYDINLIIDNYGIKPERVYLMPEGRTQDEIENHIGLVADICKEYGYNFTNRLHIELWGDKRGV